MQQYPIQLAKVQRPGLHDETLARERLLDWLQVKIHHRLVLVIAEAGYGKTTLLADFSRRTRLRTVWLRLDESDRDWVVFLRYLVASGCQLDPGFAPRTAAMLEDIGAAGTDRATLANALIRELDGLTDPPSALILDDVHLVDDVPDVRAILRDLVARTPERLSIVMASRRPPQLPLARLRAAGEVADLGTDDLRFTHAETEQLFRDTYRRPLEPDVLADLERRTEGWAASLQLVRTALRDRTPVEVRRFVGRLTGAEGELYDYLAEEVVGDLEVPLQEFLMRTAILQSLDPELAGVAADVTVEASREHMAVSERLGLLARGTPDQSGQRFHPLVRDFLLARLGSLIGDGVADLHRRVARHAEAANWRIAAHHYLAAGDLADLRRVVVAAIPSIMGNGEYATAEPYLGQFDETTTDPAFDIVRSRMELQRGDVESALEHARSAYDLRNDASDAANRDGSLANLISLEVAAGEAKRAAELAEVLERTAASETLRLIGKATRVMIASSGGSLADGRRVLVELADVNRRLGHRRYLAVTLTNLALVERSQADPIATLLVADEAIEACRQSDAQFEIGTARLQRAWALAHLERWHEAQEEITQATNDTVPGARGETLAEAAEIILDFGDPARSVALIEGAEQSAHRVSRPLAHLARARLHLAFRQPEDAARALAAVDRSRVAAEPGWYSRLALLDSCLSISLGGDKSMSRKVVSNALEVAARQDAAAVAIQARLLVAMLGEPNELTRQIRSLGPSERPYLTVLAPYLVDALGRLDAEALELMQHAAEVWPDAWRPQLRIVLATGEKKSQIEAGRLLDVIGERADISVLREFARRQKGKPETTLGRRLARRLADSVVVEDLGRVLVRVGDRVVAGAEVRRKVLSLLCYLLTRPGFSASRDEVLDAMWPDLEPDAALNSLNQTIYFLRRVFEPAYEEDTSPGYVSHVGELVWLDSDLVMSRSSRCRAMIREVREDLNPSLVFELASLYTGRFALDFAYEDWAVPFREALHAAYLDVVERSLARDAASGDHARGIALAQRAFEVAPEAEQIEASLLRLYRLSGSHAAAAEQYGHYAAMLRGDLGVEPPALADV